MPHLMSTTHLVIKWRGFGADGRSDVELPGSPELEDVLLGMEEALRAMGFRVPPHSLRVDACAAGSEDE